MSSKAPRQRRLSEPGGAQHAAATRSDSAPALAQGDTDRAWSGSPRQLKQGRRIAQLQADAATGTSPQSGNLPESLRAGIETLSGLDMSGVRVHRNSSKPATLQAHAFAQGQEIHLGPGQEQHLPHETWHVVQQAKGRVRPALRMNAGGVPIIDDAALERNADVMGAKALQTKARPAEAMRARRSSQGLGPLQRRQAVGAIPLDKGKRARVAEVQGVLKDGRSRVGSGIGAVRPYLADKEENYVFLVGLIKGGFSFASLGSFIKVINGSKKHAKNAELQQDIALAFGKVISFKDDYSAVIGSGRAEFREGRISEFEGLAGELSAAAQFIKAGKTVTRLGHEYRYGATGVQEVDVTVSSESGSQFVEVAATPSKLRDKLSGGLDGTYPQMQGYQALSREHPGSRVAYSCPTLQVDQISPELIDRVERANVELVIAGRFHDAASLRWLVDARQGKAAKPKKKKRGLRGR